MQRFLVFISKELINFITVARVKSLTKASEELYITQSPICRSLKKLEHSLGLKLFIRSGRGLVLTEDGVILYSKVISLYSQLDELERHYKRERS
ncbi:LysR family transcriptional regulator [Serratia fonticola]|uniref:LysR family transcriptional regulator n=1 Tax=Serratia fonticola TaxID=47917 RepID=UPI003AAE2B8D